MVNGIVQYDELTPDICLTPEQISKFDREVALVILSCSRGGLELVSGKFARKVLIVDHKRYYGNILILFIK